MLHVTNLHRADRILERGLGRPNAAAAAAAAAADLHANLNHIFPPIAIDVRDCRREQEMIISPWHKS